jgi:hypothetical protein
MPAAIMMPAGLYTHRISVLPRLVCSCSFPYRVYCLSARTYGSFITFERTKMKKKRSRAHRVVDHHPSGGAAKTSRNHLFWSPNLNQRAKYIPILVFLSEAFDFQVNSFYPRVCGWTRSRSAGRRDKRHVEYYTGKQSRTTNTTAVLTTRTLYNSKACVGKREGGGVGGDHRRETTVGMYRFFAWIHGEL